MVKRGVSPLIATLLLIAFVILLMVLLINWSGTFVGDLEEKLRSQGEIACLTDVNLEITKACTTNGKVELEIDNKGKQLIKGFFVRVGNNDPEYVKKELNPYGNLKFFVNKDGDNNQLSVLPIIKVGDLSISCSSKVSTTNIGGECLGG